MTYIKVLQFGKQNVVINNVEGLSEVDKQGTDRALVIESLQTLSHYPSKMISAVLDVWLRRTYTVL